MCQERQNISEFAFRAFWSPRASIPRSKGANNDKSDNNAVGIGDQII